MVNSMGGFASVSAAGRSIQRLLQVRFAEMEPLANPTSVAIARTDDLEPTALKQLVQLPALTLFLYRVDFNKTMRAAWSAVGQADGRSHLALDLHFLITAWADAAENEHRILGRAMQAIEDTPILSGPLLAGAADWAPTEALHLVLEEVDTEALMRIFDSLPIDYRLSVPYIARVVRVDGVPAVRDPDVVTASAQAGLEVT
ncbi:DUF4255 domain-containing protein [Chitiniphilus purpureus]|uniref:DUF4255 domain-containing protein n=1 Tax=Chitiniphilus purpureus TaxID=2981137 RepID=A0ABY6DLX5_9NEIS|nr:DUF4255 domain-containing protein [Chitiniphilus sp. CD1]UXY14693.1 DUF4255 domain-containing protein [Chitiniphilus sp. CD1]